MGRFFNRTPANPYWNLGYPHGPNPNDPNDRDPKLMGMDPRQFSPLWNQNLNGGRGGLMGKDAPLNGVWHDYPEKKSNRMLDWFAGGGGKPRRGAPPRDEGDNNEYEYYRRGNETGIMRRREPKKHGDRGQRDSFPGPGEERPEYRSRGRNRAEEEYDDERPPGMRPMHPSMQPSRRPPFHPSQQHRPGLPSQRSHRAPLPPPSHLPQHSARPSRAYPREPSQHSYPGLPPPPAYLQRPSAHPSRVQNPSHRPFQDLSNPGIGRSPAPLTPIVPPIISRPWDPDYRSNAPENYPRESRFAGSRQPPGGYDPIRGPRPSRRDMTTRHRRDEDRGDEGLVEGMGSLRMGEGMGRGRGRGPGEPSRGQRDIGERQRPPGYEDNDLRLTGFRW